MQSVRRLLDAAKSKLAAIEKVKAQMTEWISTFPGYGSAVLRIKRILGKIMRTGPVPRHVGVIMDGNRRYAKTHNIELKEGHNLGFDSMANILELLYELGVETATVYAFLIENFKRLRYEVEWLMDLAKSKFQQMSQHGELCEKYGIRIKIIGDTALLPADVQRILRETEDITAKNSKAVLNVCFPYTSRNEMAHAVKSVVEASQKDPQLEVSETAIDNFLYTAEAPPLDLLIRTSGTFRLLDFLCWQAVLLACTIVFSDKLWPEFSAWDMAKILLRWSFNTYWYGNGSGPLKVKHARSSYWEEHKAVEMEPVLLSGFGLLAFERYDYASDSDHGLLSPNGDTTTSSFASS